MHFFSLFLPGTFLPLTGGAASMPTVERGAPFLSAEIPPSLLCSGILFIPGAFLTLNSPRILSQPQTGRGAGKKKKVSSCRRQKKSTRSGSGVRQSLAAARLQRESLVSVCVQYAVTMCCHNVGPRLVCWLFSFSFIGFSQSAVPCGSCQSESFQCFGDEAALRRNRG